MEWSFDGPDGAVTVRREGERAVCQAIRTLDGGGLYKAWLRGPAGRVLLGTLIPEGGALRLRRTIPVAQLERQGAWPPTEAEIVMAYPFTDNRPPEGWRRVECPAKLMSDPVLAHAARRVERALLRKERQGFTLAIRFSPQSPFPVPPLFCLSCLERLAGKWYVLFSFSSKGRPELPHTSAPSGETGGEA